MVRFGVRIERERRGEWATEYLDYALLKRKISDASALRKRENVKPELVNAMTTVFQGLFDHELEKVVTFYSSKVAELQESMPELLTSAQVLSQEEPEDESTSPAQQMRGVEEKLLQLYSAANDVTQLLGFVSLNLAAVRKILKKAAKNLDMRSSYGSGLLVLRIEHPHEPGWKLLQGTLLPKSMGQDLRRMSDHDDLTELSSQAERTYKLLSSQYESLLRRYPELQATHPEGSGRASQTALQRLTRTSFKYTPGPSKPSQDSAEGLELAPLREVDLLMERMRRADELACFQTSFVHPLNFQETLAGVFEPPPSDENALADNMGLMLNCINSALYMANYNVVIPTVTRLCDHIGVSNSAVGLIIGCCDIATVMSTMGYSLWTNHSYKHPLLVSALACILGNLFYCLSYDLKSLPLLLLARLITGVGSARTVNRRYVAMFVAKKDRTWASSLFVSLSAVGMAAGPLLSLPLSHIGSTRLLGLTFGPITMGGWCMSIAWIIFALVAQLKFEDPLPKLWRQEAAAAEAESKDDLQKPLLHKGHSQADLESSPHLDGAASMAPSEGTLSTLSSDDESSDPAPPQSRLQRLLDSPVLATACCVFLCFILKVVQQSYIDGLPVFTESRFLYDWTDGECGIMLGILGLSAPFVNQGVASLASRASDRIITVLAILVTAGGAALMTHGAFPYWSFFVGGVAVYMGTIVLEGVSMSLTSKVIDERLCKGLWNAGLLSTQAGTIGRFCGNLLLSGSAHVTGAKSAAQIANFARLMFSQDVLFMAVSLGFVGLTYPRLLG